MNLSERYAEWLAGGSRVREDPPSSSSAPLQFPREISEAELQARWFAGEFGTEFTTTGGEPVEILSLGVWNREAGPVFTEAQISFRGEPPVVGGIDVRTTLGEPDPEDKAPLLSVTAGGGIGGGNQRLSPSGPVVLLDVRSLEFGRDESASSPCDSPCRAPMAAMSESAVEALLEAAAQYRLCRKAARLARRCRFSGAAEGFYQSLAETLGYRHNKLPFTLLAQRFPLSLLRKEIGEIEPLLFAGSGFLSATDFAEMPDDTRGYLREIWSRWWPRRTEFERLTLPDALWKLGNTRPMNHPQRRVAALAEIVRNWPVIESLAKTCDVKAIRAFFAGLRHSYWDAHYTLTSKRSAKPMALVGQTRVTDMLANVFFPAAIIAAPLRWKEYRELPALDSNQKVELASERLFGPERSVQARELLKRAVYQQGLLQLFEDHCADCALECDRCGLSRRLEQWDD